MSAHSIILDERAAREIDDARAWVEQNRGAARVALFDDELAEGLRRIERFPFLYAVVPGSDEVRKVRLDKSRHLVFYRVLPEAKSIRVLRVRHEARRPLTRL